MEYNKPMLPLLMATWKPSLPAVETLYPLLAKGEITAEDAVERVCWHVEDDENDTTVGYGGYPTSEGVPELDGAFMEGRTLAIGAVAGLVGFRHPVSAARAVMEKTPHNLLIGAGAAAFAKAQGLEERDMLSPARKEEFLAWKAGREVTIGEDHDTVCSIAIDVTGHIAIGCSTSGLCYRMPGRVSDTCIPGAGFFCDDRVGAAVATGLGEDIMRGSLSRVAFELMAAGWPPSAAASEAIRRIAYRAPETDKIAVMCVNLRGEVGQAATNDDFVVSLGRADGHPVRLLTHGIYIPVPRA